MRGKIFLAAVVICAVVVGGFFLYTTAQQEILSMSLETRRLNETARNVLDFKARHENLSALLQSTERELDAAHLRLPQTLEQEKFISELYQAATFSGVSLLSVQAGEVVASEQVQSQIVSVNLEASYISLLRFIREISDGERLVSLEKFSVAKSDGSILSCELSFKIFAVLGTRN